MLNQHICEFIYKDIYKNLRPCRKLQPPGRSWDLCLADYIKGVGKAAQHSRAVSTSPRWTQPLFAYRSAAISHIIQKSLHKTRRRQRNSQKQLEPGQTTRCGAKMWPNLDGAKQAETQLESTWLDSSSCHRNYYDYKGRKNNQLK